MFQLSSCRKTDDVKLEMVDLSALNNINTILLDTSLSKRFADYKAVFLENTTQFSDKDVRKIIRNGNNLFIHVKDELRIYNCSTGKYDKSFFKSNSVCSIVAFDFDVVTNQFFVVSSAEPMLYCYDIFGSIKFKVPLRSDYVYNDLITIDDNHLLLTTRTIPYPVTFIINIVTKNVYPMDSTNRKNFVPNNEVFENIILKKSPLFIRCKNNNELLIKYMFNDTVFSYTAKGKKPRFYIKKGREGLKFVNKKKIFANNNQLLLRGMWKLKGDFLIRFGNKKFSSYMLFDSMMNPSLTKIAWFKEKSVFCINGRSNLLVDEASETLFTIQKIDTDSQILPDYINGYDDKNNLLLCYYSLNSFN